MKLLDTIKKQFAKITPRAPGQIGNWLVPPSRNVKGYLDAYSQVYSLFGISLRIATAVSEVKWRLYKGSVRDERSQIPNHPILKLLDYINEFQTGQELIELTSLHMDLAGRAFWYVPKNGLGVPAEVWALSPAQMQLVPSKERGKFIAGYLYDLGNEKIPFGLDEIIWLPMPDPTNPFGGIGFAQAASLEIDSEIYAGQWNQSFFYNSARPDGALETESTLSDEEFEKLRKQWQSRYGGVNQAHKIALLEGGIKYRQIQMSQKDMDFRELRKQTRENLMFTFGIPQSVMGVSENVNRANAEAGEYVFARWLIKPRLNRIKNKLNEKLLPMYPLAKGIELDFDEVVPKIRQQLVDETDKLVNRGIISVEQARLALRYAEPKKGETLMIPFNIMPSIVGEETKPPPSAPPKSFSPEGKEAYWNIYIGKTLNYENILIDKLQQMFGKQEEEVIDNLMDGKKKNLINVKQAIKDYKDAVTDTLTREVEESLHDANILLNPEPSHRSKQSPATIAALAWLKTRIGWAAEEASEKTAKMLAAQLATGFEAGESVDDIARRVRMVFTDATVRRAKVIARTETIAAANEGALHGYGGVGVKEVEFFASLDERTDDECEALNGVVFTIGEGHGMIPIHPNCRCTFLPLTS